MMRRYAIAATALFSLSGPLFAQTWGHTLKVDEMDDSTACIISPDGGGAPYFWVAYIKGNIVATVVADTYPGEDVTVRVDTNKAISGQEHITGAAIQQFASEIRSGAQEFKVRFVRWPSGAPETLHYRVDNLPAEMDACKEAVGQ